MLAQKPEVNPLINPYFSHLTIVELLKKDSSFDELLQFSIGLSPFENGLLLIASDEKIRVGSIFLSSYSNEKLKYKQFNSGFNSDFESTLLSWLNEINPDRLLNEDIHFSEIEVNSSCIGKLVLFGESINGNEADKREFIVGLTNQIIQKIESSISIRLLQFQNHSLNRCEQGFAWIDKQGRIIYFNKLFLELTGFDLIDVKEKSIVEYDPHYNEKNWNGHWEEVKKYKQLESETIFQSEGADQRPVSLISEYISNEGEEYIHVVCKDITEKKLDEYRSTRFQGGLMLLNQLANNPENSLVDLISELLHLLGSFFGLPFGMVTKVINKEAEVIAHQSNDDDYKYSTGHIIELDETLCSQALKQLDVLAVPTISKSEYRNHLAYHKHKLEAYIGCTILVGHQVYGTISFSSFKPRRAGFDSYDIEFLKLAANWLGAEIERSINKERLIKARTIAEEAAQAKALFLSTMSHEIRTPLNGIIGIGRLLAAENLQDNQKKYVELLNNTSDNLLLIVNDILDFDKIGRGKVELEKIDFSMKRLISNIAEMGKIQLGTKQVKLDVKYGPNVSEMYHGDSVRIGQVLNNLVSNSIKFTESGTIRVSVISKVVEEDHLLKITVEDSGIGIDQKFQEKIFEDFTQAEASTTRKYGGTGLGLPICKGLLELMDSKLKVRSEMGMGATFWFEIKLTPIKLRDEVGRTRESSFTKILKDRVVLLVDDDAPNRIISEHFLKGLGATVVLAKDGQEVIEKTCSQAVDVIFMDIQMPKFDGYEATKHIRSFKNEYFKHIPIIALTADHSPETMEEIERSQLNGFLVKPLKIDELTTHCIEHFKRKFRRNPLTTISSLDYVHNSTNGRVKSAIKYLEIVIQSALADCSLLSKSITDQDSNSAMELLHKLRPTLKSVDLLILFSQSSSYEADLKTGAFIGDLELQLNRFVKDVNKSIEVLGAIKQFLETQ